MQEIIETVSLKKQLEQVLHMLGSRHFLLVCGSAVDRLPAEEALSTLSVRWSRFSEFSPNPQYESVIRGVEAYRNNGCDAIVALGGGSAIDVAKCIKLYAGLDLTRSCLQQAYKDTGIPLIAIPTTAGTGSEATCFAVIYKNGEKQSVMHESILPQYALLAPTLLDSLPLYQRKATMLDAFCHAAESMWSIKATEASRLLAERALKIWMHSWRGYLDNRREDNAAMLRASNLAGQAINITQTTAAHAMSYKLTSLFGIAHGHAAACCLLPVWRYLIENAWRLEVSADTREGLERLTLCLCADCQQDAWDWFARLMEHLQMLDLPKCSEDELQMLTKSVNLLRLKNYPMLLDEKTLKRMYQELLP